MYIYIHTHYVVYIVYIYIIYYILYILYIVYILYILYIYIIECLAAGSFLSSPGSRPTRAAAAAQVIPAQIFSYKAGFGSSHESTADLQSRS